MGNMKGDRPHNPSVCLLHISEFGKICAKFPDKAREIVTGSLNAIAPGQYVFIESTAEGREGAVRNVLNRCWFDEAKCTLGIKALENYKKDRNDRHVCWSNRPIHYFASHGADAFRMLAVGISKLASQGLSSAE